MRSDPLYSRLDDISMEYYNTTIGVMQHPDFQIFEICQDNVLH
jgi:hypothetical protein